MTIVNDRIDCDLHLFIVKWKQMARDYGEKIFTSIVIYVTMRRMRQTFSNGVVDDDLNDNVGRGNFTGILFDLLL